MSSRQVFDLERYVKNTLEGPCFICEMLAGNPKFHHHVVYEDDENVAFLSKYPTLPGYVLVCPKEHGKDLAFDLSTQQYLSLQSVIHQFARALKKHFDAERVYVLSLGSEQGNSHVHFHVVPLPKGTPYEQQQYHALMAENGVLSYTDEEFAQMAIDIRETLESLASHE